MFLDSFWNFNSFFRQFLREKNTWLFHCFVCHLKLSSFQACSEWTVKKRRTKERVSARLQRKTWFCSNKFWETGQCLLTLYRDTCWYLLITSGSLDSCTDNNSGQVAEYDKKALASLQHALTNAIKKTAHLIQNTFLRAVFSLYCSFLPPTGQA